MPLEQVINDYGLEAELREDYSGRGMYGNTTIGVVVNEGSLIDVLAAVISNASCFIEADGEDELDIYDLGERFDVRHLRQDSMGLGFILY